MAGVKLKVALILEEPGGEITRELLPRLEPYFQIEIFSAQLTPGENELSPLLATRIQAALGEPRDESLPPRDFPELLAQNRRAAPFSQALQEEWLRQEPGFDRALLDSLRSEKSSRFDVLLGVGYRSPIVFFASRLHPKIPLILLPNLTDDIFARMPLFYRQARRVSLFLWKSAEEAALGARFWGRLPGTLLQDFDPLRLK